MKSLLRDQRGIAHPAVVTFATLITLALVWNILTPVMEVHIFQWTEDQMVEDNIFEDYESTHDLIYIVWRYWPLILLAASLAYLFLAAQRRDDGYGYV